MAVEPRWVVDHSAVTDGGAGRPVRRLAEAEIALTRPDGAVDRFRVETISPPAYCLGGGYFERLRRPSRPGRVPGRRAPRGRGVGRVASDPHRRPQGRGPAPQRLGRDVGSHHEPRRSVRRRPRPSRMRGARARTRDSAPSTPTRTTTTTPTSPTTGPRHERPRARWFGVRRQAPRGRARRGGHEVTVLNRGRTPTALPAGVGHLAADRTDMARCARRARPTEWDVVYDVSGFVMAAGGSNIERAARAVRRPGRRLRLRAARSWPTTSRWPGLFPWTEDLPSNPEGTSTLRRVQGASPSGDARPPRGHRVPGVGRAAGRHLRAREQHLRHGDADVPAAPPGAADPAPSRRAGGRLLRPRRRPVRADGGHGRAAGGAGRDLQRHGRGRRRRGAT